MKLSRLAIAAAVCASLVAASTWPAAAELPVLRSLESKRGKGADFPPHADARLLLEEGGSHTLEFGPKRERVEIRDPANLTFSHRDDESRVFSLDPLTGELLELRIDSRGARRLAHRIRELVASSASGIAWDEARGRLWVLEASRSRLLRIDGALRGKRRVHEIALPEGLPPLAGLAFDPATEHLHALAAETRELLEFDAEGQLLVAETLPAEVGAARSIAIAPSTDPGDPASQSSLFVASETLGGGTATELALGPVILAAAIATEVPPLLQTVRTSQFTPPSPDPSGVELLAPNGPLLISDGEVDEMIIFAGVNLYEVSLAGNLIGTGSTTFFSDEPTGVGYNSASGKYYFSDDTGTRGIYEVTPGADGRVTPGDTTRLLRASNIGVSDPEGAAFGAGSLFVMDGTGTELWRVRPGPNNVFDGGGDDVITHFDTGGAGVSDPEGVAYDAESNSLLVVGRPLDRVAQFDLNGVLLRWLDTSAASPVKPAGLAYGPGPIGSATRRLYIVDRGVDNGSNPNENDGKLYVFAVNPLTASNQPPSVSAGLDQSVTLGQSAALDGSVSDDGLPAPPGALTTTWTQISGPGTAQFANANAVDTSVSFSSAGSYVLRLSASDSELTGQDDVSVAVIDPNGTQVIEARITNGNDDVEEQPSGSVTRGNGDLELVADGSNVQVVGLRFPNLAIPQGANIQRAWLQFQADETSSIATSLQIQAHAVDTAPPFLSTANDVSSRPRTLASAAWVPDPWTSVGAAGLAQRSSELAPVIQEVVSRPGWAPGFALAFVITGSGRRTAETFEGLAGAAPLLHVEYGPGGGGPINQPPSVSAGPDRSIDIAAIALLDGSVSDDGLPDPPAALAIGWSQVTGPGSASFADAGAVDTSASFSAPGSYTLRLTASDGELTRSDDVVVNVSDGTAPVSVEVRIAASSDDAEQLGTSMSLTSSDIELVADGSTLQTVGLRFPSLAIPQGALITAAWIQFQVDETDTSATSLTLRAQATDSAATFTTAASNVSSRATTAAAVAWSPAGWTSVGAAGPEQRTPDLAALVQEVVNRPGWASGNALAVIVTGSGRRVAESTDGLAAGAPLLHVEYR